MSHSTKLFAKAQTLIPGGVNSPVRAFKGVGGTPIFFKSGTGAYLYDLNDKKYIDYVASWGPLILGHAYPTVVEAVQKAAAHGLGFGAPTEIEVAMAEEIIKLVPSIEQVRLCSSGTEATQTAIRVARGYTQRNKILKFEGGYHGHSDGLLTKAGSGLLTLGIPASAGIPNEFAAQTLTVPFNDLAAAKAIFEKYGNDIAAVIVEPIAANMNCVPPLPDFLPGLRQLCTQYQSLLIFDEVITGFRVGLGGAQAYYNVMPDLTCLGKIIGGGLPVGAYGGKKEIMAVVAPLGPVYQAGTLSGNPVTLAAGLTTLQELQKPNLYTNLNKKTEYLLQAFKALAEQYSIPLLFQRVESLFGFFFTEKTCIQSYADLAACNTDHYRQFFHGMQNLGVYFAPSAFEVGFLSTAHSTADLDYTLEAVNQVFKTWASTP